MLTSQTLDQKVLLRSTSPDFSEINRLLAAAVVSRKFCALLLSEPARAIAQGFAGERFLLSTDEYSLLLSSTAPLYRNLPGCFVNTFRDNQCSRFFPRISVILIQ